MKKLNVLVAMVVMVLGGCGWTGGDTPPVTTVAKAEYDKVVKDHGQAVKDRDTWKKKFEELESKKTEVVSTGINWQQCTSLANEIVSKSCQGKTVVKKETIFRDRVVGAQAPIMPAPAAPLPVPHAHMPPNLDVKHHNCRVFVNDKLVADFGSRDTNYLREYVRPHGDAAKCAALRARFFHDHKDVKFLREVKE